MQMNGQQPASSESEFWEWVTTRRATESPRGDFIRGTRQSLRLLKEKRGDNWQHHLPTLNMDPQQENAYWQMRSQYGRQLRKQGARQEAFAPSSLSGRSGPVSDEVTLPNGWTVVLASPHRRLTARALDFALVLIPVALTGEQFAQSGFDMRTSDNPNALIDIGHTFFEILLILVYLGIVELAWWKTWRRPGLSLSKAVVGIEVVSAADGEPIRWRTAWRRWMFLPAVYFTSTAALGTFVEHDQSWHQLAHTILVIPFLPLLFDHWRQGWHDKSAGTLVVNTDQFFGEPKRS